MKKLAKKSVKKEAKTYTLVFDWKEFSSAAEEQLKECLQYHGLVVQNAPSAEGSDQFVFFVSDRRLTGKELRKVDGLDD